MDTDDLTEMAYRTIVLAGEFFDYLRTDIGVRSDEFSNEDEYLGGILTFLDEVALHPEEYLESWGLEEEVEAIWFRQRVEKLIGHVTRTLAIPEDQRGPRPLE